VAKTLAIYLPSIAFDNLAVALFICERNKRPAQVMCVDTHVTGTTPDRRQPHCLVFMRAIGPAPSTCLMGRNMTVAHAQIELFSNDVFKRRPLSERLLSHSLDGLAPHRQQAIQRAYREMPSEYFSELEREIGHTLTASGGSMEACLQDLDAFNSLTPETENDAWYNQPCAFTSMHLDALQLGFSRRRLQLTKDQVLSHATGARSALEVGSGSGHLAAVLADSASELRFILVDRSAQATHFAAALHKARGTGHRVQCECGDIANLPAPDASVDVVIAAEVLEHATDPHASVSELLRVLRPGGWLVISLPIDLDIAMHPTVFGTEAEILDFFGSFSLTLCESRVVKPDPQIDAIADVFPGFAGCVNAVFQKV
jgi:SAM-dependent methyltransferase